MTDAELNEILTETVALPAETEWVEFKHNFHSADEIGEPISGMANTLCAQNRDVGYIILGVDDQTHKVLGTNLKAKLKKVKKDELEHWLIQRLSPRIDFQVYDFKFEGKNIALFEIPAVKDQPIAFSNQQYIRVGSITRLLHEFPEKERKIWNSKPGSFEESTALEKISPAEVIDLLDTQKVFELLTTPYPSRREGVLEKLEHEKFVKKSGSSFSITNLGAILFA